MESTIFDTYLFSPPKKYRTGFGPPSRVPLQRPGPLLPAAGPCHRSPRAALGRSWDTAPGASPAAPPAPAPAARRAWQRPKRGPAVGPGTAISSARDPITFWFGKSKMGWDTCYLTGIHWGRCSQRDGLCMICKLADKQAQQSDLFTRLKGPNNSNFPFAKSSRSQMQGFTPNLFFS